MAILKIKDARNMDNKNRAEKLKELRMELIKSNVTANKSKSRTKEIKKAIARILSINAEQAKKPAMELNK